MGGDDSPGFGHGSRLDHRDDCAGFYGPQPHHPVTGTFPRPPPAAFPHRDVDRVPQSRSPPFPKMEFPKFDGTNPRHWRDNCEMFFEVYAVDASLKTWFAALNFQGSESTWLQMVQQKGRITDWDTLCELVMG